MSGLTARGGIKLRCAGPCWVGVIWRPNGCWPVMSSSSNTPSEDDAERVHVRARRERLAASLLRCHVRPLAFDRAGRGALSARDSEVCDSDLTCRGQKDVARADISVDHRAARARVRELEARGGGLD